MTKTIKIYHLKEKSQDRLKFVRVLSKYNMNVGLNKAKELQDIILDGQPIIYEIKKDLLTEFCDRLTDLKIMFEVNELQNFIKLSSSMK